MRPITKLPFNQLSKRQRELVAFRAGKIAAKKGLKRTEHNYSNPNVVKAFRQGFKEVVTA